MFSWFRQWNKFENRSIFGEIKAYKSCTIQMVSVFNHPVCLELLYGPYHSPTLGDTLLVTVDVTNDAANGQLGFDDVTVPLAPPPTATEASQLTVSWFCCICAAFMWKFVDYLFAYYQVCTQTQSLEMILNVEFHLLPHTQFIYCSFFSVLVNVRHYLQNLIGESFFLVDLLQISIRI